MPMLKFAGKIILTMMAAKKFTGLVTMGGILGLAGISMSRHKKR